MSSKNLHLGIILLLTSSVQTFAQDCAPSYILNPVTTNNTIEWNKFPEFSLPFKIIYNGPRFGDTQSLPLKHGFSHLALFSGSEPATLPAANRALLWNSVATIAENQPWGIDALRSPWGNDTIAYRRGWAQYLSLLANSFQDSQGSGVPKADIICLDVERMLTEDRDIIKLKTNPATPAKYTSLSDADFIATYKRDIRWWYTEAVNYLKSIGFDTSSLITSYSDVPVRATWLNIESNSWQDWTTNAARTHYLMQDNAGKIGGTFYNAQNGLTPSPYYYYGYNSPIGKDYLTYLLFQIEVNRAWSDKPIIPFVWMRIHDSFDPNVPMILPFQAQATAIFPFFSGAKGLWLWENGGLANSRQENYAAYENFIYGLYRLSEFKDMFEGDYELVIPESARDLMTSKKPVWRGVVKNGNILIAAQNPYAGDTDETSVTLSRGKWVKTVKLKGKEVFLCKYDLSQDNSETEPNISEAYLYPNPMLTDSKIRLTGINGSVDVDFSLLNNQGTIVYSKKLLAIVGSMDQAIDLPPLGMGLYIARFKSPNKTITQKIIITK